MEAQEIGILKGLREELSILLRKRDFQIDESLAYYFTCAQDIGSGNQLASLRL